MPSEGKNLSDSRGNSLGIGFFKCCMLLFGQRFCAAMVWFVATFYALFDNAAFNAARPYLHGRFPDAGCLRLRWLFYRMAVAQGQVIILAHWLRTGHSVPIREYDKDILYDLLTKGQSGLILLISHAGCWQAALTYLESFGRPINLLFQANRNGNIAGMFKGELLKIINNDGPFGGLLECISAIEKGEIVCIMGDRQPHSSENSISMAFNGQALDVPESPWLIAARCRCPIIPVFTMMTGLASGIDFYFRQPINVVYESPVKPRPEHFAPYVAQYATALEEISRKFPFQIFHYKINKETWTKKQHNSERN